MVYEGLDKHCKPGLSIKACQNPEKKQVSRHQTWFHSSKPGLSTFEKFHKPGLATRKLTKLNEIWIFDRFMVGLSQVLVFTNRFTTFVQTFENQVLSSFLTDFPSQTRFSARSDDKPGFSLILNLYSNFRSSLYV
jgi:hypothetical protein